MQGVVRFLCEDSITSGRKIGWKIAAASGRRASVAGGAEAGAERDEAAFLEGRVKACEVRGLAAMRT
jgi:hypothetical protein